jgi:nucleoside-diphosphate-sugar epimerase
VHSYGPGNSGVVTETSPLADADSSPRVARLVQAEEVTLKAGGTCLRLAGLYSLERGPHNFWITKSLVESSPQGLINMLHYDDAASACLAALRAGPSVCQGRAFLISDGHAISRYDICASAIQASLYARYPMPTFTDATANQPPQQPWALGKVYDGSASNTALQWSPKYKSFDEFMKANS